jgi:chromosome partitioning protein
VLLVDLDPQANATSGLGERANGTSSYDLLDGAPLAELAGRRVREPRPRPVQAGARRRGVELARRDDGERFLAERCAGAERYAFVFLDCPPSLGR